MNAAVRLGTSGSAVPTARLSRRALLERQWRELQDRGSAQAFADALLGRQQLWWEACGEAVRDDPRWLSASLSAQVHEWIRRNATDDGWTADEAVYAVAGALGAAPALTREHVLALKRVAGQWEQAGLLILAEPARMVAVADRAVRRVDGLADRVESVNRAVEPSIGDVVTESQSARAMVVLAALLLAGAGRRERSVVRIPVVFSRAEDGAADQGGITGFLELREFPAGPAGLFPDPQYMAAARRHDHDPAFGESLAHAWVAASGGKHTGRCVLWRVVLADDPAHVPPIGGGSLGAAFAVGLREVFSYPVSRRPSVAWLRRTFHGLRPRTAVTGVVDEHGDLQRVTGMGAKLSAAHRKRWRLVAPVANQADIAQAPDLGMVKFAASLSQADRYARQWRRGRLAAAALTVLALAAGITAIQFHGSALAARNQAIASQIDAEISQLPPAAQSLAAQLDIVANQLNPTADSQTRLLDTTTTALSSVLTGPAGTVTSVTFSPDGKIVAAGSDHGGVWLWNLANPTHPALLARPLTAPSVSCITLLWKTVDGGPTCPSGFSSVTFSPDGTLLAAGSVFGDVWLWNLTDPAHPRLLGRPLTGPSASISSLVFSPDGKTLAASGGDDVWLWNMADPDRPALIGHPRDPTGPVSSIAFSPDGKTLVSGDFYGHVRLWNLTRPALPGAPLAGPTEPVSSVTFSPDGKTLAASSDDAVWLWNLADHTHPTELGHPLTGPANTLNSIGFSPDGTILAAGGEDDSIWLWNLTSPAHPALLGQPVPGPAVISSLEFSPGGTILATANGDSTVRLWNLPYSPLTGPAGPVDWVAFDPHGTILAAAGADGDAWLWSLSGSSRPARPGLPLTGPQLSLNSVSFSPDGKVLAAGGNDAKTWLWSLASRAGPIRLGYTPDGPALAVESVAFRPVGRILAAGGLGGTIWLWNLADPARPRSLGYLLPSLTAAVGSVAFSPDGRILAAGDLDGTIWLWNVTDPAHPTRIGPALTGPTARITALVFSPSGKTLAATDGQDTVWLWNLTSPTHPARPSTPLTGPGLGLNSAAFSPDGKLLAAGGNDDKIWLWNLTSPAGPAALGQPLTGPTGPVSTIAFGPGGEALAAGSGDDIWLWNLDVNAAIQRICATTSNILTPAQWKRYIPQLPYGPPCSS